MDEYVRLLFHIIDLTFQGGANSSTTVHRLRPHIMPAVGGSSFVKDGILFDTVALSVSSSLRTRCRAANPVVGVELALEGRGPGL